MDARTAFAWGLVVVLALVTWLLIEPFLGWLLATGFLAFVLAPAHRRLAPSVGDRLSAGLLTILVVVLVFAPLIFGLNAVIDRAADLVEGISRAGVTDRVDQVIEANTGWSVSVGSNLDRLGQSVADYLGGQAPALLSQGLHAALGFLLLTFVLYYLLKDGEEFVAWLHHVIPLEPETRESLFSAVENMAWAVLKGHVLVAMIQGAVAGLALFVTGVPYAFVLTLAMMVLALVPIVGLAPVLGGAIGYLFVTGEPLAGAFVFVWGMTTVAITDDYLRAVLIDRGSQMHSAFVFVGILGGSYLLGAIGLFVGPIVVGLFKTTVEVLGESYDVLGPADDGPSPAEQ